jgi:uncharacterized protein (TIGR02594 family)
MCTRRQLTLAIGLVPFSFSGGAFAADAKVHEALADYAGRLPTYRLDGRQPAARAEVAKARDLLLASPRTAGDVRAVARYFESLMDKNAGGERYNAAWAKRWNPVIVGFYKSTSLKNKYVLRQGDVIPWSAAFLNWCLAIAGCRTTKSATSGAFRTHGRATTSPASGDIVVFSHADPTKAKSGQGHVGLYMGREGDKIRVLGGNPSADKPFSSVNEGSFLVSSPTLVLHSFRSVASLQA